MMNDKYSQTRGTGCPLSDKVSNTVFGRIKMMGRDKVDEGCRKFSRKMGEEGTVCFARLSWIPLCQSARSMTEEA
jgi:hypothetical protein